MESREPFTRVDQEKHPTLLEISTWMKQGSRLTAGFTSRIGGVSEKPFDSLNCGLHVLDRPEDVVCNRQRLASAISIPLDRCTYAEQVHGNDVVVVTSDNQGKGHAIREEAIQDTDGMITNESGIALCMMYADCVPLFFWDPSKRVIGVSHAGWKGSVLDIAGATVAKMNAVYGSEPQHIQAAIGPSIGGCCYEVDERIANQVTQHYESLQIQGISTNDILLPSEHIGKYMLNLKLFNQAMLLKAGIVSSHIEVSGLCTSCHTDLFFSHRKEHGQTGRMVAWMAMKES
ncbi:peptidoglycan editing factor PgeF [Paenibacillus sp. N1-5-1-14]|uniref:peptidoglycan editing factor PgeF n=1 Tax=Paenibacillus radicibacter TaxID=2972488 RepID=UPI0021599D49|nr:peptidoglycan editing factor PgeF [Paenibacillus radicibacter]MCR8641906.1 peptidoglycan editing factor PgeF [Paenibacillus radicibacter]